MQDFEQGSDGNEDSIEIKQRGDSDDDYSIQEKINKKAAQILGGNKRGGKRRNKLMDDIDKVSLASDVDDDSVELMGAKKQAKSRQPKAGKEGAQARK